MADVTLPNGITITGVPDELKDNPDYLMKLTEMKGIKPEEVAVLPDGREIPATGMTDWEAKEAAKQAGLAGEFDFPRVEPPVSRDMVDYAGGAVDLAVSAVRSGIAVPVSGLAATVNSVIPGAPGFIETQKAVEELIAGDLMTETGRQMALGMAKSELGQALAGAAEGVDKFLYESGSKLGGHTLGAIAAGTAEALPMILGVKGGQVAGRATANKLGDVLQQDKKVSIEEATPDMEDVVKAARAQKAAELAKPKASVIDAADELGIKADIPAPVVAGSEQFREVAGAVQSRIGSDMKQQMTDFDRAVKEKADEIIVMGGGDLDKGIVSKEFRDRLFDDRETIKAAEKELYGKVEQAIPASEPVDVPGVRQYIDQQIIDFGGIDKLPKELKDLAGLVYDNGKPRTPTYAEFEHIRKAVGEAKGSKKGQFGDAASYQLGQMYDVLKKDKEVIADRYGVGDTLKEANRLTIDRKAIEDAATRTLGKDGQKDLMPEVSAAIKQAANNKKISKFNNLLKDVPADMRQRVVMTAVNDLIKGSGADQTAMGAAQAFKTFAQLNRSPSIKKEIFKHIPKEQRKAMDNLSVLAESIYEANKANIQTGRIMDMYAQQEKVLNRLLGAVKASPIPAASTAADAILNMVDKPAEAANKMLASPAFQQYIRAVAKKEPQEKIAKLDTKVRKSEAWRDILKREFSLLPEIAGMITGAALTGGVDEEKAAL